MDLDCRVRLQVAGTDVVWPRLKVFWFSKHNPIGHSKRKRRRDGQKKRWVDHIKELTEMDFPAQLGQLKQDKLERDYCKFICGAPGTFQGFGLEYNRYGNALVGLDTCNIIHSNMTLTFFPLSV